jgi:hypothetical protein
MLAKAAILLAVFVAANIVECGQTRAQDVTMDFAASCLSTQMRGMAAYRECIYDRRLKAIERMRTITCSARKCYYKLSFAGRVRQSTAEPADDESSYLTIFRGAKFIFIDGKRFPTGDSEFSYGALLIDETAGPTILRQCTGNGCTDLNYVRGAHRGAKMYGPFDSDHPRLWILELPR